MKIEMDLSPDITEPYVVIHTNEITDHIKKLSAYIQNLEKIIAVYDEENIIILDPEEIYMIISKGRSVDIFCKENF